MPGFQEVLVIVVVAMIVVGPQRMPKLARDLAKLLVRVRRETTQIMTQLKREVGAEGLGDELRDLRREVHGDLRVAGVDDVGAELRQWRREVHRDVRVPSSPTASGTPGTVPAESPATGTGTEPPPATAAPEPADSPGPVGG